MGTITDLDSLVKWCTADEAGRLGTPGLTVGRLKQSTLKKLKHQKCRHRGAPAHEGGSRSAREKECKAFGKTCSKCQKPDHFASVCKSIVSKTNAITEEEAESTADGRQNSLSFNAIQADHSPSAPWRPWLPSSPPPCNTTPTQPPQEQPEDQIQYSVPTHNRFILLEDIVPNISPAPALARPVQLEKSSPGQSHSLPDHWEQYQDVKLPELENGEIPTHLYR